MTTVPASTRPSLEPVTNGARGVDVAALFRTHKRTVMRWAARFGGPGIEVEDVLQEVFLIANRRLRTFESEAGITKWLFRTTEKVVLTARRKQRMRRWLSRTPEAAVTTMGAALATPAERLERDREIADVYRILDRLPEKLRRILILFELEDLSTAEIASLVGAKVTTVRVWLFRARERFLAEHERSSGALIEKEVAR